MSAYAFSNPHPLGAAPPPNADIIKKMLLENEELIKTIYAYQKEGKVTDCFPLQKILHRNLVYLATLADANIKMDAAMASELGDATGAKNNAATPGPSGTPVTTMTPKTTTPISTAS